jgi:hypothetical protein
MGDELTVESALAELREIFPKAGLNIYTSTYEIDAANNVRREVKIVITEYMTGEPKRFYGQTLADCMAQVRAWAKERGDERAVKGGE